MVKFFLVFVVIFSFAMAEDIEDISSDDALTQKIKTLIDVNLYKQNKAYIDIIFSPKSDYYNGDRVDAVKVVQTLKENGLLDLFFKKPRELNLSFKTSGAPLFFVKIMGDTLRNIGYYRYVTKESALNPSEFVWTISLTAEYATDPLVLQKELQKSGCSIIDIQRDSATNWSYVVDMRDGYLNLQTLHSGHEVKLKRSLYAHWLNVSQINRLKIYSSSRNSWYPYVAYYDSSLHLLKVIRKNAKRRDITLEIPNDAVYIKISDIYTLKNIKDGLVLTPVGTR
jgi:hypothetical protein